MISWKVAWRAAARRPETLAAHTRRELHSYQQGFCAGCPSRLGIVGSCPDGLYYFADLGTGDRPVPIGRSACPYTTIARQFCSLWNGPKAAATLAGALDSRDRDLFYQSTTCICALHISIFYRPYMLCTDVAHAYMSAAESEASVSILTSWDALSTQAVEQLCNAMPQGVVCLDFVAFFQVRWPAQPKCRVPPGQNSLLWCICALLTYIYI